MSLKQQAAAGVVWTAIATLTNTIVQFGQLAVLARLLQPSDFGLMAMVMVVIGFANSFADMGISNAIIHRQDVSREQLSSLYWLNLMAGVGVCGVAIALSPVVAQFYQEPRLVELILWTSLVFVVTPLGQQFQMLLQKQLQFRQLAGIEITAVVTGCVVALLAAWQGWGVLALVWGQLVTTTCRAGLLAALGWMTWRPMWHFRRQDLQGFVQFGLYQMGERSINYFAWNMDKLLIGRLLGPTALGFYNVAYQLMVRPLMVLNPVITRVAFPVFSSIQTDDDRLRRGYIKISQIISFTNMPLYLGMFAVAPPLITLLLGANWQPAIAVFQVLVWLGILYSLGNPIGSLLLAKGRADMGFWCNVWGVVVYAIAIQVGSQWGVLGVAWGLLISNLLLLSPVDFILRWWLVKMRPVEYLMRIVPFLLLSLGMMAGVIGWGQRLQSAPLWLNVVASTLVGASLYLGGVWFWQRDFLRDIIATVRTKPE